MNEKKYIYETTQFTFAPATEEEQNFCFSLEGDPIDSACVGHLRGDFGALGECFYTSWFPHNEVLKTQLVITELDDVVNALRNDGWLSDYSSMQHALAKSPQAVIQTQYRPESAFRAETEYTLFFLRCIPQKGDYNFYLYVYDKEQFYAVQREQKQMPRICWSRLKSTNEIVLLRYGVKGYFPFPMERPLPQNTQQVVDELNQDVDISKAQAAAMEAGSLFGWNIPAADPKNYDADGRLRSPKNQKREVTYER